MAKPKFAKQAISEDDPKPQEDTTDAPDTPTDVLEGETTDTTQEEKPLESPGNELEETQEEPKESEATLFLRNMCELLYGKITDGQLRRHILDAKKQEPQTYEEVQPIIYNLLASLIDGNDKALVKGFLEQLDSKINKE